MKIVLIALGALLVIATALPFIPTAEKWIRVFDFPRVQIAVLIFATGACFLFFLRGDSAFDMLLLGALVVALGWQLYRIYPYTPLAPTQVTASRDSENSSCLRIVIANVLMENRNAHELLRILKRADPDVVLLVETDEWWDRALHPLKARFPHSVHQPQDNYYGMVFYSRYPLESARVEFLIDENIPSIHAHVMLPDGRVVAFYGVHPVPPPLADTEQRDAELLVVGKKAKANGHPAIVAGDLNDVGWSATTRLFVRISGLLDPRRGRGFYASYNANNPLMRWPLDYIFHDPVFTVHELRLLESFGSDHFPVFVHLCREPQARHVHTPPKADAEDRAEAKQLIKEGHAAEPGPDDYPKEE